MNISLLPEIAWLALLVFARLGTLFVLMPGIGESSVPMRARLVLALATLLVVYPSVSSVLPPVPTSALMMLSMILREILIGLGIGLAVRFILAVMQTAGTTIAFQMGLGFALNVDPSQGTQGVLLGNFLGLLGVTLIFLADLHHLALVGIVQSYVLFGINDPIPIGDFTEFAVSRAAQAFSVAIQISAPFMVFGLIFYLGLGILSRLMPQLQIFMIAMPVNIVGGFLLLAAMLSALMTLYIDHVRTVLMQLLPL
ncbi:MAG: flagellar biosynthetic protein FliR [Cohaesibacteraceae bacterium]